jgi:AcrR family transcriptional regulator
MKVRRSYDMTTRSIAAAETAERIVAATMTLLESTPITDITLGDVAANADVTIQTVLRRFGDRDSVFAAAIERFAREVFAQRGAAEPGDTTAAVTNLLDHYERFGSLVLKMIAQQGASPALRAMVEGGAEYHRDWCARVFAASLTDLTRAQRARRLAQFTAVCDVRTWHLLRHDGSLSRAQTHTALLELLEPLLKPTA